MDRITRLENCIDEDELNAVIERYKKDAPNVDWTIFAKTFMTSYELMGNWLGIVETYGLKTLSNLLKFMEQEEQYEKCSEILRTIRTYERIKYGNEIEKKLLDLID